MIDAHFLKVSTVTLCSDTEKTRTISNTNFFWGGKLYFEMIQIAILLPKRAYVLEG